MPPSRGSTVDARGLNPLGYGQKVSAKTIGEGVCVIILGLILLIIGLIVGSGILWVIGLVLILVGALLWLLGSMDRAIGGRRHWY
jgi:membrane-bound ClpP family serine protease